MDEQIIKLFGDQISGLGTKIDKYHAEIKSEVVGVRGEVKAERERVDRLESNQQTFRVWGLVALFAGGAGGSILSNILI